MKYEIVLFDADGTLLDFLRSEKEAVSEALKQMGVTPTEEMLTAYSAINDELWKQLERGDIQRSVLLYHRFELLFNRYGLTADAREMAATYMRCLSEKGYVIDGAEELCKDLFGKCRLYIVTNGTEIIQKGRFARSGLQPYFEEFFISEVIGFNKPDGRFFEHVASKIPDFSKEKAVIVGDSLSSDIRGGIGFGIDTCWYNPEGKPVPEEMSGLITYVAGSFDEILSFLEEGARV